MGNGHPVAAVITRAEIVDRFAAGTTFFSTFGGNPVACAAALAVLDVLEDERLVDNAASVGDWLRARAAALGRAPPCHRRRARARADDRRRAGPSIAPRASRPRDLAARVKDEMAERGVLIGTTGRHGNVLKIRPPLCITRDEAATHRQRRWTTSLGR